MNVTPGLSIPQGRHATGMANDPFDEIDTVFGPKAKDNEEIRGLLNAGHGSGAVAGGVLLRAKTVETEEIPAYCAVALAGIGLIFRTRCLFSAGLSSGCAAGLQNRTNSSPSGDASMNPPAMRSGTGSPRGQRRLRRP